MEKPTLDAIHMLHHHLLSQRSKNLEKKNGLRKRIKPLAKDSASRKLWKLVRCSEQNRIWKQHDIQIEAWGLLPFRNAQDVHILSRKFDKKEQIFSNKMFNVAIPVCFSSTDANGTAPSLPWLLAKIRKQIWKDLVFALAAYERRERTEAQKNHTRIQKYWFNKKHSSIKQKVRFGIW